MAICKLCTKDKNLKLSHIFSRFIVVWLRNTGTGNFRNPEYPNKREQDGPKTYLLCQDCENLFGKNEDYFRNNIFYPIINSKIDKITITQEVLYFVVSILWRILILELECLRDNMYYNEIVAAEKEWRNYLYHKREIQECKNLHLLIISSANFEEYNAIPNFNRYITRDLDGTFVSASEIAFQYAKFSRFILVAEICKNNPILFSGTNLILGSCIKLKDQKIEHESFTEFLISRIKFGNKLYDDHLSESQESKILNSIKSKNVRQISDYFRSINEYLKSKNND